MKAGRLAIYIGLVFLTLTGCEYNEIPVENTDCNTSTLAITITDKVDATSCVSINGSITVSASGGKAPYSYSMGNGYQANDQFFNVAAGIYLLYVKDDNGCIRSTSLNLEAAGSDLEVTFATTADNECSTNNGSITIVPTGGLPPYRYSWDGALFDTNSTQNGLRFGQHNMIVRDNNNCQKMVSVIVPRGNTDVSYAQEIKPILTNNCAFPSCHGSGNGARDWTVLATVQSHAAKIKFRTGNRSMPLGTGKLTQEEIDKIACWVDDGAKDN